MSDQDRAGETGNMADDHKVKTGIDVPASPKDKRDWKEDAFGGAGGESTSPEGGSGGDSGGSNV